jgi:hypothetical protein
MQEQILLEMALDKDGDLPSSMSVEDSKEVIAILINIELENMFVFHGFPPASHVSYGPDEVLVF